MIDDTGRTARTARLEPGDINSRMTTVAALDEVAPRAPVAADSAAPLAGKSLIQSVERALDILECLANARHELQLQDITRPCGLNASTGHHLLNTLVHRGYVARSASGRGYRLGAGLLALALARRRAGLGDLAAEALPTLRELATELGETVVLATLAGSQLAILARHDPTPTAWLPDLAQAAQAAHATAWGKAILAWLPEPQIARVVADQGFNTFTGKTIGTLGELAENLRQSRRHGFALDDEEFFAGLVGIACTLRGSTGEVLGALGCALPAERASRERLQRVQLALAQATAALSRQLVPPAAEGV